MLRKIIIDDQNILALIHEVFTERASGIRRDERKSGGLRRARHHDGGIIHGPGLLEFRDDTRHLGFFLSDGDIDTDDILAALIDDRIDGDSRFASLTIPDDKLTLAATDRNQRIDRLDSRLKRLID